MSHPVRSEEVASSLKTYLGYLDDLCRVDFEAASTKLRLVVNYARKDLVTRGLAAHFHARLSRERFLEQALERLELPEHPLDRMTQVYLLLLTLKEGHKLNLRSVLTRSEFAGGGLDQRWGRLAKDWIGPYREHLGQLRAWTSEHVQGGAMVEPEEVFAEALEACFGAPPPTSGAAPRPPAPAPTSSAPAAPAAERGAVPEWLAPLAGAVAELAPGARAELEVDLQLLALERRKRTPDPARVDELVASFAAAGLGDAARRALGEAPTLTGLSRTKVTAPPLAPATPRPAPQPEPPAGAELAAEPGALEAERAALAAERAALAAERQALSSERAALAAERVALEAERAALAARRSSGD